MIQGKGTYLWQVKRVAGGDANAIAEQAKAAGLSHVLVKVADGRYSYNITNGVDMVPALVTALRARGIKAWGWQYVYGSDPPAEAKKAIERVKQFALDGFVVNAEAQFKTKGMDTKAKKYMQELRKGLPYFPIGLSTYRYPTVHYQFPFKTFLDYCDFSLPQVYWVGSVNAGQQLKKSVSEYNALKPGMPIVPPGAAYAEGNWTPTPGQVQDFLTTARSLNLPGANFWEMATAQEKRGELWQAVQSFNWQTGNSTPIPTPTPTPAPNPQPTPVTPKPDIVERYINALNSGDPNKATVLYEKNTSKHKYRGETRQGRASIYTFYNTLFKKTLPGAKYRLIGSSQSGSTFTVQWQATAAKAKVQRGKDTIVMSSTNPNLIATHTTDFVVAKGFGIGPIFKDRESGPIPV
jgi:hypothetical protein